VWVALSREVGMSRRRRRLEFSFDHIECGLLALYLLDGISMVDINVAAATQ